ncbi:MAG TPA: VOC family protein [Ornithinimicrobium sp.]|nr:VOC family protein [Ornithinimicrobium sp.]
MPYRVFLAESHPELGVEPPAPGRGAAVTMALEVEDCAAAIERVRRAGGRVTREPEVSPERVVATFLDPGGHRWMLVEGRRG